MATKTSVRPRPKLDRDVVVDTALAVVDAEGLDAATIRRLAQELSVTPMALYWHFKDKDALLAAMADRLWEETLVELDRSTEELVAAGGDAGGWAPLRLTLAALITAMRRHPALAASLPGRVVESDAGLLITERTLAFLAARGFDPPLAAEVARFALCGAVMLVDGQPGAGIGEPTERTEAQRRKRIVLASLPPDRFPHIVAAAGHLTDCSAPDALFERGVELVVAGVRDLAPPAPPAAGRRTARVGRVQ